MSKITDAILKYMPNSIRQIVRNRYYEVKISNASEKDEEDLIIVSVLVSQGDMTVDVGANYGLYTKFMAQYVGKTGFVYSFEPIKKTYLSLVNNVKSLNLSNVNVLNMAVSDTSGKATMVIPDYAEGGENLYEARISQDVNDGNSEEILTTTLDSIVGEATKVSFIKIDVEGHELNVLQGSIKTIEKDLPSLLIEINGGIHRSNESANSIIAFLKKYGYEAFIREGEKLNKVKDESEGFNFFFLTPEHQERFKAILTD